MNRLTRKFWQYIDQKCEAARRAELRPQLQACGKGVFFARGCVFVHPEKVRLADYIYFGPGCFCGGVGKLTVGTNTGIGPKVHIYTDSHRYEQADEVPFDSECEIGDVTIGNHVWVGGNAVIVPGVTIADGAVIAAGSVVSKDVPYCSIVAGNPAKVVKMRDVERFEKLVANGAWHLRFKWQAYLNR